MILVAVLILLATPLVMLILRLTIATPGALPFLAQKPSSEPRTPLETRSEDLNPPSSIPRLVVGRSSPVAYYWLAALVGTLTAWPLVLLSKPRQAYTISLVTWSPATYFLDSPKILVDSISWSFALAIATLVLAVILTAPMRLPGISWHAWASSLALAGFGLLAVLAENPLTLMLAWAAIDILEIAILLVQVRDSRIHVQALAAFAARVGGLGLLLWADVTARTAGSLWSFTPGASSNTVQTHLSLVLIIAAGLRLGVLPLHLPFLKEPPLRRGLGTSLRLVPAAASLVLLVRTANVGVPAFWVPYLLVLVGLSALYGAILWAFAPDELSGRPFWILSMTAFAVASAVCGLPGASLAWGLACIFSGGLLFLVSDRHRNLLPLLLFGLLGFVGLPFTPAWGGMQLYASPSNGVRSMLYLLPIFLLAHALLVSGYIFHTMRSEPTLKQPQRWVWVLYPLGLSLLPLVQYAWFWYAIRWRVVLHPGDLQSLNLQSMSVYADITHGWSLSAGWSISALPIMTWIGGVIALGVAMIFLWIGYRRRLTDGLYPPDGLFPPDGLYPHLPRGLLSIGQQIFSLNWLYKFLGIFLRLSVRFVRLLTGVLEGDGGILWVLVLLALLVALLLRGGQL